MRERGLKRNAIADDAVTVVVAPHAGAWIETRDSGSERDSDGSLPMRERGLKQANQWRGKRSLCRSPCGSVD